MSNTISASFTTLKPLSDHLIIRPLREETTASGLVLPNADEKKADRGTVIAVGPGRLQDDGTRSSMDVAVGDHVLFSQYAADGVTVDGEDYLIVTISDVKAILQ